jgi:MSHA biogenesis protein MshO
MRARHKQQTGFTLVEMIMVMVITGIIGGMVAIFIRAPVQGYVDSARRAELTDIADTAMRRMARDVRTAVPNSVRTAGCGATSCVEFLPTKDGGRYRASVAPGVGSAGCGSRKFDVLDFTAPDSCFEILGTPITFVAGDQIVVGSTQSDGNPPYQDPTNAACTTCIRRPIAVPAGVGTNMAVVWVSSSYTLPAFSELDNTANDSQRFDVVDGTQQAVTYACVGVGGVDANGNGLGQLMRYWKYGYQPSQQTPTAIAANPASLSAILADKVDCTKSAIDYSTAANTRFGLLSVWLTLTSGNESVTLYNEIHVNNAP